MDELSLLQTIVADEPLHDAQARSEVWMRLRGGSRRRAGWRIPRRMAFVVVVGLVVATVILGVRE